MLKINLPPWALCSEHCLHGLLEPSLCVLVHLEIRQWRSIDRVPRAQRLRCCTIIQAISNSQERVDRLAAAVPSTLAVDVDNGGRLTQCGTESSESTLVLSTIHMRSYAPVEERDATKSVVGIMDDCPLRQLLLPNVEAPHAVQHVCDPTPSQPRLAETVVAPAPRAAVLGAACSCPPYCAAPSGGASPLSSAASSPPPLPQPLGPSTRSVRPRSPGSWWSRGRLLSTRLASTLLVLILPLL